VITEHLFADDAYTLPDRVQLTFQPFGVVRVLAGVRVGVLFVRPACWDESVSDSSFSLGGFWLVDIPTHRTAVVSAVREFWNAILIADEVSRFAERGVEALLTLQHVPHPDDVSLVFGADLCRWLAYVEYTDALGKRALAVRPWCELLGIKPPRVAPLHGRGHIICNGAS